MNIPIKFQNPRFSVIIVRRQIYNQQQQINWLSCFRISLDLAVFTGYNTMWCDILAPILCQNITSRHVDECCQQLHTETEIFSFWWNFDHWLHCKLSFWQLSMQPSVQISLKWRYFFRMVLRCWLENWEQISINFDSISKQWIWKWHAKNGNHFVWIC